MDFTSNLHGRTKGQYETEQDGELIYHPLLQAHQEVLLKSELAAPGSLQKQCLFSLQPAPPKSNKSLPLFFLLPPSCPVAIKRPVYYETWPPCGCCYWRCWSQPQVLGT